MRPVNIRLSKAELASLPRWKASSRTKKFWREDMACNSTVKTERIVLLVVNGHDSTTQAILIPQSSHYSIIDP